MKKFVRSAALFSLVVFGVIGGFCVVEVWAEVVHYRAELKAPADATVFVCGDSRTEVGLNPEHWPGLFNFSVSGRTLDQTYLTAQDIVSANPGRFKQMIVDVSPECASWDYGLPIGEMTGVSPEFYLLYVLHSSERLRGWKGLFGVFRDVMVNERVKLVWRALRGRRAFRSSLASGYKNKDYCLKFADAKRYERQCEHLSSQVESIMGGLDRNARFFALLERLVAWGRSCGLEVVLITAPWHQDLRDRVGIERIRAFTSSVEAYAHRRGCRYLCLMDADIPDRCWRDVNHLNCRGAETLTKIARDWLGS